MNLPVEVDPATPLTGTYAVEWNSAGDLESWTTNQVTSATVSGGTFSGTTSGTAPQVIRSNFSGPDLDLGYNDYLELRIQVPASHTGDIRISYGTTATTGFNAARVLVIPDALVPADGNFHTYRIDVGPEPWWRANLTDLRVEPSTTSDQAFSIDYLRVGDLPGDVYLINPEFSSDNEMTSKHFRFLWSAARAAEGIDATKARGALRNAEEAWQVYVKVMGYREPAESTYSPNGNKYKTNFLCIYDGFWMNSTGGGFAFMNIAPVGLQVDPPTWVIPHELMHVFQHHNNNGHYSGQWETHANYGRARWLKHYQNLYPNSAGIEALGVRDGHFMISSGRNYYLTWPFLYYIDDNPDNLPDLSNDMTKRLWQEGLQWEFWATTLDRLTPTTSLKDISGYYARRCATWDFSNQAAMNAELNAQDPTRNARHLFTDLIQRADDPTWWRVPPNKAPAQGAYAMHELIPAGSGAGRVVTVNLQGLADSARGADWRASFVAVSDTGVERYTPLWNNGSSSITLAADENKLYLSVAGTPDWYANGGHDEAAEPFRSHPSRSRFHYQVQVTGATPRERTNGSTTGMTQHSNGGGYRSVSVPASVYIGPNARVTGGSVSGNARIEDYAVVSGGTVNSSAVIGGHAWVRGGTVTGNARVRDWAIVDNGTISGNARVLEHATVEGNLQDTAVAKGSAWHQSGGTLSGNAIVDGDYMGNKSITGGITFGHLPFVGIPDNFTTATPAGHYASYDFGSAHDSRALDRYGVTDSFPIGSPAWTSTDWKRKGFLSLNGSNQYVALDRSVADTRSFTFAAWVKPAGGPGNQAALWLGASSTKRLYFTPDNGSGQAKFSIVNGGAEQSLTSAALPTGVWSHVAITLDGATGTLQINGSTAASGAITLTPDQLLAPNTTTGTQHNYLARSEGTLMPMFQGAIDDVQFFSSALTPAQLAAVTVPLAGDVLLSDNFDSASNGAGVFNSTLSADQQGLQAPLSYTITGNSQDWQIQHGNGSRMLLAGWNSGISADLYASLNYNFANAANGLNKPLKVQFDLRITDSSNVSNWATVAIGSAQNAFVNNSANKFSSLFRHSGGTQQFASAGDISQPISWTPSGSTIAVILSDSTGNGSPFNGNGSVARMYVNEVLAGTWTLAQMSSTDGYISFEGNGVFASYDNLSVSVVTATTYAVTYNGNGGTGFAPIDSASPYAQNSTVTVLGNTGGLEKIGYSFANWNTAANGSGTPYNPGSTFSITAPVTLYAQWQPGPDFIWDNGATTNVWSTTDANWLGASWVNSPSHNAWFQTTGGAITLAPGLTAGNVNIGNISANFPATSFSAGSLSAANLIVQGFSSNNGDYAANPTLTFNSVFTLSGDASIGRANLTITGGSLSANRIISNAASADWGRLAISGGTVTATNGVDGSANTAATFQLELNGGTLETPSIRVANRDLSAAGPDSINDAHLILNGGTVKAIGPDNANFITLYGDTANGTNPTQATYVQSGGAIIDTNGRNIGIQVKLLAAGGSGGLTKNGAGALTLTASNNYAGATTVNAGTLIAETDGKLGTGDLTVADGATCDIRNPSAGGALADTASVHLNGTGKLIIASGMVESVSGLYVNGVPQGVGLYTSLSLPSNIAGSGSLNVLGGTVELTAPVTRQIVQRNGSNTGSVVISGSYTSPPDSIEARAVIMTGAGNNGETTPWTTIVASPSGGTFSGTLSPVAAGGWYQIEVRCVAGGAPSSNTAIVQRVGVGDLYLTAGQSNSANYGEPGTNTDDRVSAMNYANRAWTLAADPMPGADGPLGSVWTRLGTRLTSAANVPVGFVCVGVGGTPVSYWVPPATDGYLRLKAAAQAFPANGFRAVLWHQGESDSFSSTTPADYQTRLSSIIAQLRTDAGWTMPWYVAEASFHPSATLAQEEPVAAGQRRVIFADPLVFAGPVTDDFHLEGKLYDTVHFNASGMADHAQQWADVLGGTAPLAPKNGDFESNTALADGGIALVNTADVSSPSVIGWRILNATGEAVADGGCGYFNPDSSFYGAAATDAGASGGVIPHMSGRQIAFLYGGSDGNHFLQTRRATLQPNTTYALTVALGIRGNGNAFGNARIELLANGISLASRDVTRADLDALNGGNASNTFSDVRLTYVSGAPVAEGQPLSIRITKLIGQISGNPAYVDFDNVRLETAVNDYDTWASAQNVTGGATDDDDHDGQSNFMEYAFGLDPANPSSLQPIIGNLTPSGILSYTRRKTSLTGLTYTVWTSDNLTTWNPDGGAVQSVIGTTGDIETVQVTLSAPAPETSRRFIRISAQ